MIVNVESSIHFVSAKKSLVIQSFSQLNNINII